jgi:hypothetical protein
LTPFQTVLSAGTQPVCARWTNLKRYFLFPEQTRPDHGDYRYPNNVPNGRVSKPAWHVSQLFNGVQWLGDFNARFAIFNHRKNGSQMPIGVC